jgi:transposase
LNQDLENIKCGQGEDAKRLHQVLKCKTCNIYWNRDTMASKNMFLIAQSIWNGQGRPNVFKKQFATSNVVASSHSGETLV